MRRWSAMRQAAQEPAREPVSSAGDRRLVIEVRESVETPPGIPFVAELGVDTRTKGVQWVSVGPACASELEAVRALLAQVEKRALSEWLESWTVDDAIAALEGSESE